MLAMFRLDHSSPSVVATTNHLEGEDDWRCAHHSRHCSLLILVCCVPIVFAYPEGHYQKEPAIITDSIVQLPVLCGVWCSFCRPWSEWASRESNNVPRYVKLRKERFSSER